MESEAQREAEHADQQVAHLVRVGVGVEVSGFGFRSGSRSG